MKLKLRHAYTALITAAVLSTAACVFLAIQAVVAGRWLDVTVTSSAILLVLWVLQLLPRRPSRAQRAAAKALYVEAERLIFAMTSQRSYRVGNVLFVRMRKPGVARVLRLNLASCVEHSPVDTEVLTLFVAPLVYRSMSSDSVVLTPEGTVTVRHSPRRAGWWGTMRELRLIHTLGAGLLSIEELRTLVEQLRIAEPLSNNTP